MPTSPAIPRKGMLVGALVAIAALLLGWLSQFAVDDGSTRGAGSGESADSAAPSRSGDKEQSAGANERLLDLARREAGAPLAMGQPDAPVVMIEYADFGCSYCGKFARDTAPDLVRQYVDKGVLRIEWRNYPIFGADSKRAARAAWAAGQQSRFWQFHHAAYADEEAIKHGYDDERLTELARQAGVPDIERFHRDRKSEAAREAVRRDLNEGYRLGVRSTPSFLINDQPLAGAQPIEVFEKVIEQEAQQVREATKETDKETTGETGDE